MPKYRILIKTIFINFDKNLRNYLNRYKKKFYDKNNLTIINKILIINKIIE